MSRPTLRTAELAAEVGVAPSTVRYYEQRGLLDDPGRDESGYRAYPPEAIERLRFIRRAQDLGFTLSEIKELIAFSAERGACAEVCGIAEARARELGEQAREAAAREKALLELLSVRGHRTQATRACPVLAYLEGRDVTPGRDS